MRDLERKRIREREYKKMQREDPEYVERLRSHARDYNRRLRQAVLERLGQKCSRCGYKDVRALEIDHKFGGGTEERRRLGPPLTTFMCSDSPTGSRFFAPTAT